MTRGQPQRRPDDEPLAVEAIIVDAVVVDADIAGDDLEVIEASEAESVGAAPDAGAPTTIATGRHLRVAPDSVRRRRHVRIAATAAAVSISATLFAVVGFNVELAQNQIKLQKLEHSLQSEQTRYFDLRSQVAADSAPAHIVGAATAAGLVKLSPTYLPAEIKPPPPDTTGTSAILQQSTDATKGSLDPVQ